jgi:hypothetical protein
MRAMRKVPLIGTVQYSERRGMDETLQSNCIPVTGVQNLYVYEAQASTQWYKHRDDDNG